MATADGVEKQKGSKLMTQNEMQMDAEDVGAIVSVVESNSALVIDEPVEEASKERAASGHAMQA